MAEDAGVRDPALPRAIPEGEISVFVHGTNDEVASAVMTQQASGGEITQISASGGRYGGEFYMSTDVTQGDYWAGRTVQTYRGQPRLLGIVFEREVFNSFLRNRLIRPCQRIQELRTERLRQVQSGGEAQRLGMHQYVVQRGDIENVISQAFFFLID